MSLNCQFSGFNGRLSTCSKLKEAKEPLHGSISVRKWRRRLLFFCLLVFVALGSIGFLLSFNHGTLWGKDEAPNPCKEKLKSCYNIFNVSKNQLHAFFFLIDKNQLHALTSPLSESDQMTSLQCTKELGSKMQLSDSITCTLCVTCSEMQEFHKQHTWLYTVMNQGTYAQFDENIYRMLSLSIVDDNHVTFCLAI